MEKYTELKKKKLLVKDELFALETKCWQTRLHVLQ
jgi:hypothetical protein